MSEEPAQYERLEVVYRDMDTSTLRELVGELTADMRMTENEARNGEG